MTISKPEFAIEFRRLLAVVEDSYIRGNLERALNRYEKGESLPRPKVFLRDPRNLCVHGNPLGSDCDPCIESYGNAQPVKGEYVEADDSRLNGEQEQSR